MKAAKHLSGTSLANLEPNRNQFESENENLTNVSKKELNSKPNIKNYKRYIKFVLLEMANF